MTGHRATVLPDPTGGTALDPRQRLTRDHPPPSSGGFAVPNVTLHHVLTGSAAAVGAVRFDIDGVSCILLAKNLSVEEQSSLLGELLRPDDTIEYSEATTVPPPVELAG